MNVLMRRAIGVSYRARTRFSVQCVTSGISREFSYYHSADDVTYLYETIGGRLQTLVELHPDRDIFAFPQYNIRYTYSEFLLKVDKLAAGLRYHGHKRGDRIAIWAPNIPEWVLVQYACFRGGFILVNLNPAYKAMELQYALQKVQVKTLVTIPELGILKNYNMLTELCPELASSSPHNLNLTSLPDLKTVIMISDSVWSGTLSLNDVLESATTKHISDVHNNMKHIGVDEAANIQFTSGTTGNPKGALLSHFNLLNNGHHTNVRLNTPPFIVNVCPLPLFHTFAMTGASIGTASHGGTVIFPSVASNKTAFLEALQNERATLTCGVPTTYLDLVHHPQFDQFDISSLQLACIGGSTISTSLVNTMMEKLPHTKIVGGYGMTETTMAICVSNSSTPVDKLNTSGRVLPNLEVKVIDPETHCIVEMGETGEICCRGYNVMLGYWNDDTKTNESLDNGHWWHTGDLGTMDADGYLRVVGRIKDLIIKGGRNIVSLQVEDTLMLHPAVKSAQVFGVPDDRQGEEVACWIQLKDGHTVSEKDIQQFCVDKMAYYKAPKYIRFVDCFPMTATGKAQKFKMQAEMTTELQNNIEQ